MGDTRAEEGQDRTIMELTQTPLALVKKTAARRMQDTQRQQAARQWAARGITYGSQGLDWITVDQALNHRKSDGRRKAAIVQLISFVVPTRDQLRRQAREVVERCECGQCVTVGRWLAGCEHYPITEWLERSDAARHARADGFHDTQVTAACVRVCRTR